MKYPVPSVLTEDRGKELDLLIAAAKAKAAASGTRRPWQDFLEKN